jgi:hypothetical protein
MASIPDFGTWCSAKELLDVVGEASNEAGSVRSFGHDREVGVISKPHLNEIVAKINDCSLVIAVVP